MFRFVIIANQVGLVQFSHYFEAVPDSLKIKLEREAIEKCLNRTGEKEVSIINLLYRIVTCCYFNFVIIKRERFTVIMEPSCFDAKLYSLY